jgi:hypothetical protein
MPDVFLVGAGFSRWFQSGMPLLSDLTAGVRADPEIAERIGRLRLDPLIDTPAGIEFLLSHISTTYPWKTPIETHDELALYELIQDSITAQISAAMSTVDFDGKDVAYWLFEYWSKKRSTILSFNYDTIIEQGLDSVSPARWSVYWRLPILSVQDRGEQPNGMVFGGSPQDGSLINPENYATVLKLHGSYNWLTLIHDPLSDQIFYHHPSDNSSSRRNRSIGMRPLIVPPSIDKSNLARPNILRTLWQLARQAVASCDRLFIIGYSLPITDVYVNLFLSRSLPKAAKVHVVNIEDKTIFAARIKGQLAREVELDDSFGGPDAIDDFINWLLDNDPSL